jgi:alkylation response protein AidB-like acyl-CoA dehydrogenase
VGGLHFNNVALGEDALLGPLNRGFHIMMSVLEKGRIGIGALAVGIAQAGLDAALGYAKTRKQFGRPAAMDSSIAKCFAADVAVQHTANAVQIFGGSGFIRGFEVERLCRDAKIAQIYEGTNQIQRSIIARELLRA